MSHWSSGLQDSCRGIGGVLSEQLQLVITCSSSSGIGGLFCGQDFLIVGGDDLLHVGAGGVRELQVLPVEDLAQGPILGEAFVDQGEESCSNVGCRTHRVPT